MHKTHQLFEDGNAQNSYQEIDNRTVNSFISNLFQRFESIEIIWCFCKGIYTEKLQRIK